MVDIISSKGSKDKQSMVEKSIKVRSPICMEDKDSHEVAKPRQSPAPWVRGTLKTKRVSLPSRMELNRWCCLLQQEGHLPPNKTRFAQPPITSVDKASRARVSRVLAPQVNQSRALSREWTKTSKPTHKQRADLMLI